MASERESGAERRQAFEAETLPHLPRIHAAARRLRWSAGATDAEDLVQETYLRAYRTFDNFERGTNVRAWLLTILYSIESNRRRRSRRAPEAWSDDDLEARAARECAGIDWQAASLAEATAGAWGAGETVTAALKRLPEPFRMAVLAVDLEGLTYEEAAVALECPIGTVRSRLARARRRLAVELAEYARRCGLAGGDGDDDER